MDGASTDETAQICEEYRDRLTFISEKDRGQAHAINKGFAMARGEIVAWLNSDDIFLPGAISHAVDALTRDPSLAMVYGEGYQIDIDGNVLSRFNVTQEFDLWRLRYVSDYVLQQTTFFRKWALDAVGLLDESLYYALDWELFIRIGERFPVAYIPEYMGAIREYAAAKSFSGGERRFREIARMLRRHGSERYPPAYFIYGLTTYEPIWNARIARWTPHALAPIGRKLQRVVTRISHHIIGSHVRSAQGWYSDGWAARKAHFMLPASRGRFIELDVSLPIWAPIERQTISVESNGAILARETFDRGNFTLAVAVPKPYREDPLEFTIRAARAFRPNNEEYRLKRDVAYILRRVNYPEFLTS